MAHLPCIFAYIDPVRHKIYLLCVRHVLWHQSHPARRLLIRHHIPNNPTGSRFNQPSNQRMATRRVLMQISLEGSDWWEPWDLANLAATPGVISFVEQGMPYVAGFWISRFQIQVPLKWWSPYPQTQHPSTLKARPILYPILTPNSCLLQASLVPAAVISSPSS